MPSFHPGFRTRIAERTTAWLRFHRWRDRYRETGLSVILALQASVIFIISPLASASQRGDVIEAMRFGLAATAILIVNRNRLIGATVAATFVISLVLSAYLRSGAASEAVYVANILFTIAFDLAVAVTVAHAAFDGGKISLHRIMGAIILYLYIGLIFASVYRLAALSLRNPFTGLAPGSHGSLGELLYFSLSALTTSGFGDIVPHHPLVRSLANLESLIGQLYPATFLARLVTLHGRAAELEVEPVRPDQGARAPGENAPPS